MLLVDRDSNKTGTECDDISNYADTIYVISFEKQINISMYIYVYIVTDFVSAVHVVRKYYK